MIRLREGNSYIDREGFVVSVKRREHGITTSYPFIGNNNRHYMADGRYNSSTEDHPCDLISEVNTV